MGNNSSHWNDRPVYVGRFSKSMISELLLFFDNTMTTVVRNPLIFKKKNKQNPILPLNFWGQSLCFLHVKSGFFINKFSRWKISAKIIQVGIIENMKFNIINMVHF